MTIDEAISDIEMVQTQFEIIQQPRSLALDTAISTMRKYQKIVDIVSLNDEEFKQCGLTELKGILEVIADGKID